MQPLGDDEVIYLEFPLRTLAITHQLKNPGLPTANPKRTQWGTDIESFIAFLDSGRWQKV